MRASHIAIIVALMTIPSVAYSQDSGAVGGPVGGKVGSDLNSSSPAQSGPSLTRPNGSPPTSGPRAGYSGGVMPGQVVPQNVPVAPRPGGQGTAFVNGHRVLVDPGSNRILRVIN